MPILDWLLDADPAVRWQALRDLADAPPAVVAAERARVAEEGWGRRLLDLQGEDGQWAGGACFPNWTREQLRQHPGQPWISTLPVLQLLVEFGIDPDSPRLRRAIDRARDGCRWEHAGQPFFDGEVEPCINGRVVAIGSQFGQDVRPIVDRLLAEQLPDGGWNCEAENGSVRSSFHTTINVLEGLLAFEGAAGGCPRSAAARARAEEYLLERNLLRRKSTGEIIHPDFARCAHPVRWRYDLLRALDYFRAAGTPPDARTREAISLLRSKRQADGTWLLEHVHPGAVPFEMEAGVGQPSRWNTLRAMRVLRWADASAPR